MKQTPRQQLVAVISRIVLWIWVLLAMIPLVWMVTTSLKPEGYAQTIPPTWIFQPTFQHYIDVWQGASVTPFAPLLLHSLIVAVGATALALLLGLLAAYALARVQFRGKRQLAMWKARGRVAAERMKAKRGAAG